MPGRPARRAGVTWLVRLAALAALILLASLLLDLFSPFDGAREAAQADGRTAVVEYVYDGDTIRVTLDGESTRVRLLNIDAPEDVFDGNTRFLHAVEEALDEAEDAGLGMFDPRANCQF